MDGRDPLLPWKARRECQEKKKREEIGKHELEAQETGREAPTEMSFGGRENSTAGRMTARSKS